MFPLEGPLQRRPDSLDDPVTSSTSAPPILQFEDFAITAPPSSALAESRSDRLLFGKNLLLFNPHPRVSFRLPVSSNGPNKNLLCPSLPHITRPGGSSSSRPRCKRSIRPQRLANSRL